MDADRRRTGPHDGTGTVPVPCTEQGYNLGGVPLLLVGMGKGVLGLLLRPGIGGLEATSKTFYGLSLATLGKQVRQLQATRQCANDTACSTVIRAGAAMNSALPTSCE